MKNLISVAALALLVLLAASPAAAQSTVVMRARIPFQFLAGDSVLPAGSYLVRYDPGFRRVELASRQGYTSALLQRRVAHSPAPTSKGLLVFHKYGRTYALREIWRPGQDSGFQLFPSKAEKEMVKAYAASEVATIPSGF